MMPLSISHQLIPSRGMAALMNHESSKNFSKSPNSSSSSIASTSGNSSCHSSSLHENQNQQVVANSIFVDVNNFSSGKKHQHNQLLDKFYQSLQAVDENGYKSAKYRLDREQKLDSDMSSIALLQHQQSQLVSNLTPPFNNVTLFNNPFLQSYYFNLASKSNIVFPQSLHGNQMKSNDVGKFSVLSSNSSFSLKRSRTSDSKASNEEIGGVDSESESGSISKNCSPVRNN